MATHFDFNPVEIISLGKRNDLPIGFSSFKIGDLQFWENYVHGMPFQSIGNCRVPFKNFTLFAKSNGVVAEIKDL